MQNKHALENADEYVVWQTGYSEDAESDDEESSGPCGECAALDGQGFFITRKFQQRMKVADVGQFR